MNIINTDFSNLSNDGFVRMKYRTQYLKEKIDEFFKNKSFVTIKECFFISSGYAFNSNDYCDNGVQLIRISDLNNRIRFKENIYLPYNYSNDYEKYLLQKNDILISLTGDGSMKLAYSDVEGHLINQRIGILREKNKGTSKKYFNILNSDIVKSQFEYYSNGKSQLNISPNDLSRIKLPKLSLSKLEQLENEIRPLENEIEKNIKKIKSIQFIIDDVFKNEFSYNYNEFEELNLTKMENHNFFDFANNIDLRFSSKYHRKAGKYVFDALNKNSVKLKKVVEVPIMTGKGVKPNDYSDDSECYYVTMADISTWNLDYENLKFLSKEYENSNSYKKPKGEKKAYSTKLKKGDIIMMRSGEGGIGKVALVDENINAIYSDFLIRFRFNKQKYLSEFCYYYMRTKFFQYLIEIHKKGLGNNTNIFPKILGEFPIPDISLEEQKLIANKLREEVYKQNIIKQKINEIEKDILEIIETV